MEPVYRYVMPYPYQRDHTDYRPNCYPRSEAVPPQMYTIPARPPVNYEYWPWGSNYGYAHPVTCHGCCNHSHMPTYYAWRPPYSPVPSSHYPGSYPPFPSEYVPPPFYPMEQPQLAYNNNTPRDHHCCGCLNHLCSQKEQKNVKIEEEEPEREVCKKAPVAPFKFTNSPYPLMRLPIDHGNDKAHQEDLKDGSANAKPYERKTDVKHTGSWHGWYPFELQESGSPKEKEENRISSNESDHSKRQFPFPVFWMPYMPEENKQEEPKDINIKPQLLQESVKDSGEQTGGQVYPTTKDIPVKEAGQHEESVSSGNKEDKRESSLKDGTDSGEKLAKNDPKRKASSPPKSSKLPPVCLRVDSLPRTKAANGKSRSPPSPPSDRQKHDQLTDEVKKVCSSSDKEKSDKITGKEIEAAKGTTKTVEAVDGKTLGKDFQGNPTEQKHEEDNFASECTVPVAVTTCKSGDTGSGSEETGEIFRAEEVAAEGSKEVHKPKLSEDDAAIIIQSAYRGFDIRRWELVKKLKQISSVREQIPQVKNIIRAMESSSDIQANSKQRNIVAETIMSLLLKLDTIQGLHPSIREMRKFVVRELVNLQEKLDALIGEQSKFSEGQESVPKCEEYASKDALNAYSHNSIDLVEPCQTQLDGSSNVVSEILEKIVSVDELNGIPGNKAVEISENSSTEGSKTATGPIIKDDNEQGSQTEESPSDKDDNEDPVQANEFSLPQDSSTGRVSETVANNEDKPESESTELPIEVSGDCQECKDHTPNDADVDVPNQAMQIEQRLPEAYSTESNHDVNEGKHDHTESLDMLNVQHGEIDINSYSTETIASDKLENCKLDDESGTMKQVDNATGEDSFEHDKCSAQSPKSVFSDIFGSSEVFGESENPVTKASNEDEGKTKMSLQGSSFVEEALDVSPEKEFDEKQEAMEEFVKSADLIGEKKGAGESSLEQVFEDKLPQEQEQLSVDIKEGLDGACVKVDIEHEAEDGPEITVVKSGKDSRQGTHYVGDESAEKEGQLIKENEMLRDMVEKLMKSGEEQLRVITSLSGRVKDLERKMSKKKKLKMKQYVQGKKIRLCERVE